PPAVLRKPLAALLLVAAALVVAAPALAGNGGFAPPDPQSPNADRINDTYWVIVAFTGFIFLLVEGCLIAFVIKYRRRARPAEEEGPQVRGHHRLEIAWTVLPVLILAVIGSVVFYKLPGIADVPSATAAGGRLEITVEGRQFYWNYRYPNGVVAVDRLRVPVNRVVKLHLVAPDFDVIHSWWVPQLGGKRDVIPGQPNDTWFQAEKEGLYLGQCAELCGIQHAAMRTAVEVLSQDEYDRWLEQQAQEQQKPQGETALGRQTFRGVCAKCHGFEGEGLIGPEITAATVANTEALEDLVRNGRGAMPPVGKGWEDSQVQAVIEYLQKKKPSGS
ncbi:MAG TPA: cytochrome c oxidase subunit II, partial [Gaiellaceae bacterium]|nr:cytochrome c oxidase subunit II [Gaiellaceae bacterium]